MALAVLGLVLVIVHRVFVSTLSVSEWRQRQYSLEEEATAVLRRVAADLRGTSPNWITVRSPKTPSDRDEGDRLFDPPFALEDSGNSDALRIVTTAPSLLSLASADPFRLVEYRVRQISGRSVLTRSEGPIATGIENRTPEAGEIEIANGVDRFEIKCFDGKSWRDAWKVDSPTCFPAAVEIHIKLTETPADRTREPKHAETKIVVAIPAWSEEYRPEDEDEA